MARMPDMSKLRQLGGTLPALAGGLGLIGGGGYFLSNTIFNVEAGHRALKFNRLVGLSNDNYPEGTHFRMPWLEWPILIDIRTRAHNIVSGPSGTGTRDLQMVNISLRTLSRPDQSRLTEIYRRLGPNYDEVVLLSLGNEVLKAVVARFSAQELMTQRDSVSRTIRRELTERATEFGLIVDDVAITALTFSPEFAHAVEQKQVAQTDADRAKYLVVQAEEKRKQAILKARGTEREAQLIGDAMKGNPSYVELKRIENAQEIARAIAKSPNKVVLSAEGLMLNLLGEQSRDAAAAMHLRDVGVRK